MKAIVYTEYGSPDNLELKAVEKPQPQPNEVLVRIHAVALNFADGGLLAGKPFLVRLMTGGLRSPRYTILGADIAGEVEAVGSSVTQFKPGDAVFGDISECGFGGLAEYVCATEEALAQKPTNVTYEDAAAVPMAAVTALQGLKQGRIRSGQKVLVNGASGGVGSFAVQIARSFGAEVTAVCSTAKLDMARSMGADHVIDYKNQDFTKSGQQYDLIIAANGYHPIADYRRSLKTGGAYVCTGGTMGQIFESMILGSLMSIAGDRKMGNLAAHPNKQDLTFVSGLLEAGQVKPVIDRCYPLSQAAEAFRYLREGHASGKIVITVANNDRT